MEICPTSSFIQQQRVVELPSPAHVRALNISRGHGTPSFDRPPPVTIPSLGLLIMIRETLKEHVPIPEVFGWAEDGGQTFIYMSLVHGQTLNQQWPAMDGCSRLSICSELRHIVKAWRTLEQDVDSRFVGNLGKGPLKDIFLRGYSGFAGPFKRADAVHKFHSACGIDINPEAPIKFTHVDLVPLKIILSPGLDTKVAAIVDWGQAGWYPEYWGYCKVQRLTLDPKDFDEASQRDWSEKYLPLVMDPAELEMYYYPWLEFVLSKGF
ncbi:hypothetical protein BX600DRAFT_540005 [Xylariales sp. PMI_506]|nr:hypothetical protein BX600DRAFT_540005 [Xylariales sp. PMI_506]